MYSQNKLIVVLVAFLLLLISEQSRSQDFHERNLSFFSRSVGISDNHFLFVNMPIGERLTLYGGLTAFTEIVRNQSFLLSADYKIFNTDFIDLYAGAKYASSFSDIQPYVDIPISMVFKNEEETLFLLTGLEFYYYSKFQTFFNSEFIVIFHGDYFGSLAYKNNPYFPTGDHIISVSGGLIEGMVSVKVGTSVPDDFNIKQALLTLSFALKLGRFKNIDAISN